jgi:hypothetical protein
MREDNLELPAANYIYSGEQCRESNVAGARRELQHPSGDCE